MYNAVVTGGDVVRHRLQEDASIPETHRKSATMSANWERGASFQQCFHPPQSRTHSLLTRYRYCYDTGIKKQIKAVLLQIHGFLVGQNK